MSAFKVGDVCEWVYSHHGRPLGDCVVVAVRAEGKNEFIWREGQAYACEDAHGVWGARIDQIRLKRPPTYPDQHTAGDWDLIPWRPAQREKEHS